MKVGLHIGGTSPHSGGGYTFATELLSALCRIGDQCAHELVFCHHDAGENLAKQFPNLPRINLEREKAREISWHESLFERLPRAARRAYRILRSPTSLSWEERILRREGIQFLVRLTPWDSTTLNIPFATIVWDLQHRQSPWFPEVSRLREWEDRESNFASLRRASIIITGTERGRDEISTYYQIPHDRIKVLPFAAPKFGGDVSGIPPDAELLHKFGLPAQFIFYPAQFWPHKNHVAALEACKIIRDREGWDLGVVFTGSDAGNLEYVRDYARRLGLERSTKFLGFVDPLEVIALYRRAFCLAFPSFFGPDNLPPLEAMSLGCPVVAADVPGAQEQLGDGAILFPPSDERSLANAVVSLRDPDKRKRLIAAGHARAASTSWDRYAQGIIESLDQFALVRRAWP